MSEQEFDEFFKKKAEDYEVPYNPKAWERMRARLDRAGGVGGILGKRIITGLALLLVAGMLLWWSASRDQAATPAAGLDTPTAGQTNEATTRSEPQDELPVAEEAMPGSAMPKGKIRLAGQPHRPAAVTASPEVGLPAGMAVAISPLIPFLQGGSWAPFPVSTDISLPDIMPAAPVGSLKAIQQPEAIQPTARPFYRVGLSLLVSPDLSALQLSQLSQVGAESGIGLEFFIVRKLSINAGIIFSKKLYAATGGYEPSPNYYKYYPRPSNIDAACQVLDLPLNLRYYAIQQKKNRAFVSSGLSSYLMLREQYWYDYKYTDLNNPKLYRYHGVRNENRHYFSVANFSLGYERALGKRWALQAEPFIKVPLAGVGEGKVKLMTAGMFFSVHYRMIRTAGR